MTRLLIAVALVSLSLPAHAYRCTGEDGIQAARDDDRESTRPGWAPRRWMAWCRQCGGTVTSGRCVGPKLDGGGTPGGGAAPAQARDAGEAFVQGYNAISRIGNYSTPNMAATTIGYGMANGLLSAFMHEAMRQPTPQELAARQAARQEQIRLQQEAAERERQRQAAQHAALVDSLRGYSGGGAAPLSLRGTEASALPGSNLDLLRREGGPGVPLTPFENDASRTHSNLAYLRRSEPEAAPVPTRSALDQLAAAAVTGDPSKPFDSAATRLGGLPEAPPTPAGKPVGPAFTLDDLAKPGPKPRVEVARVLDEALVVHKEAETAVKAEVARLEKEPNRDPAKITQELEKLERIQTERKQIEQTKKQVDESKEEMVDLSIKDLAGEATSGGPVPASTTPAAVER